MSHLEQWIAVGAIIFGVGGVLNGIERRLTEIRDELRYQNHHQRMRDLSR